MAKLPASMPRRRSELPMSSDPDRAHEGNLLLAALAPSDVALLTPYLARRQHTRGDVLFRVGDDVSHVNFPVDRTVATLMVPLNGGRTVETATVGHEGAVGGVVSHGYLPAFTQCVVQVEGAVLRMDADRLRDAKRASSTLSDLFVRYADCMLAHPFEPRHSRFIGSARHGPLRPAASRRT